MFGDLHISLLTSSYCACWKSAKLNRGPEKSFCCLPITEAMIEELCISLPVTETIVFLDTKPLPINFRARSEGASVKITS